MCTELFLHYIFTRYFTRVCRNYNICCIYKLNNTEIVLTTTTAVSSLEAETNLLRFSELTSTTIFNSDTHGIIALKMHIRCIASIKSDKKIVSILS